jgi:hypothetical protein
LLEATVDNIQPEIDYYLHGGLTAAQQVLPDMIERDCGTPLVHHRRILDGVGSEFQQQK